MSGETLVAWAVGTGWQRGGTLAWSLRGAKGNELEQGRAAPATERKGSPEFQVPVWSFPAAVHLPGTGFIILH